VFALAGPHYFSVDILDVGQGDAIFIETPDMRHILIDGGPDALVMTRLQKLLPFWERRLDVAALTHPDLDHLNGLLYVLQRYQVDYVVWTGIVRDGAPYQKWVELLAKAKQKGTRILTFTSGDRIKNGNAIITALHPFEDLSGQVFKNKGNDTGIVLRAVYGENTFLFTADTSSVVEEKIIDAGADIASDVLKVGHHGSLYSTSEKFLEAVRPEIAVISVGAHNSYGHPTPEVLQRLEKSGIKTFRTDQDGTVKIVSDGDTIKINKNK